MNIAIIEDEILTQEDLAEMIGRAGKEIHIVAVLGSVRAAIEFFRQQRAVDLVFSDIQLGDGLSFEVFRSTPVTAPIVFCTAYDEYALDAIRSNGIEYILKPYTQEAITSAIEKYRRLKEHFIPRQPDFEMLIRAVTGDKTLQKPAGSILVYHRDKILPVSLEEIALFYVDNECTHLHGFNGANYLVNQALDELEQLSGNLFFRINRQYLVNRRAIKDANHYQHRKYVVNLSIHFKEVLVVSKNRTMGFLQWLTL
ncbi:MAG: DNA-binding response regulator [Sphingobacteriales bacterium 50-39]|nr:response regulator transcription factor [Sphingobacteriales bacterium]OJW54319.1 MAG: DNA-binding response regulator [Sphingobacteriales bacterium 50-39]